MPPAPIIDVLAGEGKLWRKTRKNAAAKTMNNKVEIKLLKEGGGLLSYDVRVLDQEASVQDYLDALNGFQEEKMASCDGCSNCCWERVPLTAPDVWRYAAAFYGEEAGAGSAAFADGAAFAAGSAAGADGAAFAPDGGRPAPSGYVGQNLRFIREYGKILGKPGETGEALDICLGRLKMGNCVFLDTGKQRCRAHALRPLVCQSYLCLPASPRASALRRQIVNEGENELIHLLGEQVAKDWEAYQSKGFGGKKSFAAVVIREAVNESLWRRLLEQD
jgi:Fe-S-cluster containining protein